jgi:hypothetical protein
MVGVGKRVCKDNSMVRCAVMCIYRACLQWVRGAWSVTPKGVKRKIHAVTPTVADDQKFCHV